MGGTAMRGRRRRPAAGALRSFAASVRRHALLVVGLALYLSWLLAATCTGLPFPKDGRLDGNVFDVAVAAGFLSAAAALRAARPGRGRRLWLAAGLSIGCCLLCGIDWLSGLGASAPQRMTVAALKGALLGASAGLFARGTREAMRSLGPKEAPPLLALASALALLLLSWVNLACDPSRQWLVWPAAIAASLVALLKALKAGPVASPDLPEPGSGTDAAAPAAALETSARHPGPGTARGFRPCQGLPAILLALNGAFAMFLVGNFPQVFHLALFSGSVAHRGMASGILVGLCDALCLASLAAAVVGWAALACVLSARRPHPEAVVALAVAALVAVSVTVPTFSSAPVPVLTAIAFCLAAFSCLLAAGPGSSRAVPGETDEQASARAALWLGVGMAIGACGGLVHIALPIGQVGVRQLAVFGVMIAFVAADAMLLFKARGIIARIYFPELADGRTPGPQPSSQAGGDGGQEARCQALARRHGLTPRETDVLVLLAQGRDGPYIQEALGISRNTFKTHALHIHQKLGVGSQQDIIDLAREG